MAGRVRDRTPLLEWVAGLIGLTIVVGSVGFLVYQGIRSEPPYPELDVQVVDVKPQADGYLAVLRIDNRGGATAQNATVTGRLQTPEGTETSEVTVDYVPAESSRRAGLFFTRDPRRHPLHVRAEGYQKP